MKPSTFSRPTPIVEKQTHSLLGKHVLSDDYLISFWLDVLPSIYSPKCKRSQSPEWLPEEISHHVMPLAKRYGLDLDGVLLDYMRM